MKFALSKTDATEVTFSGNLDEHTEQILFDLAAKLPRDGSIIRFFWQGVAHANSLGIQSWVGFLEKVGKSNNTIEMHQLTEAILLIIDMMPAFYLGSKIVSCDVELACKANHNVRQIVRVTTEEQNLGTCKKCSAPLLLPDDLKAIFANIEH